MFRNMPFCRTYELVLNDTESVRADENYLLLVGGLETERSPVGSVYGTLCGNWDDMT